MKYLFAKIGVDAAENELAKVPMKWRRGVLNRSCTRHTNSESSCSHVGFILSDDLKGQHDLSR